MSEQEINELVWQAAIKTASSGPGYAQERVVLRQTRDQLREQGTWPDLAGQRQVLNAWQDLFTEKRLGWGYDLDNPQLAFLPRPVDKGLHRRERGRVHESPTQ